MKKNQETPKISLWARLFKRPKVTKIIVTDPKKMLHVIEIENEKQTTTGALAMTAERADELVRAVKKSMRDHDNIVAVAEEISPMCKHANELFFITIVIVKEQESNNDFGSFLRSIVEGRQRSDSE